MSKGNLKKQSQFANWSNWRKVLYERILLKNTTLLRRKKQSQSKPISKAGAGTEWIPAFAGMTNMESLHSGKS
jgi:hypothetical protein